MINKIKLFFKNLIKPKSKQKYVSHNEVKRIYKNFSKNQLINVIIKLANENAFLKAKKTNYLKGITK
jgi:hypothetical protein